MSLEQSRAWFCRRLPLVSEYLRMLAHLHFHIVQSSCIFSSAANALRLTARRCCWRGPTRLSSRTMTFAAVHESAGVQVFGRRRSASSGHVEASRRAGCGKSMSRQGNEVLPPCAHPPLYLNVSASASRLCRTSRYART